VNQTLSRIRLATPADEPELLHLTRMMHAEGGMRRIDMDCVRAMYARAFNKQGGIVTVIGPPGNIRAMQYLLLTTYWYSRDEHLEELFNWVHPDHRNSDYAKLLIEHAKKCSDEMSNDAGYKIPLIIGVLTNKRMTAKVRLYRRFLGWPFGAVFLHNADFVNKGDASEEDIWRMPNIAKMFFKREQRVTERDKPRVRA
jgi:hypothetical protein